MRRHRRRQRARRRRQRAVETDFAEADHAVERVVRQRADRGHHRQRDRQIVMRALFRHVGGGEIDDQPPGRNGQADRGESGAYALARFGNGLIAQADDDDAVRPARELNLDLDPARFEPLERHRGRIGACLHNDRLYPQTEALTVQN